MKPMRKGALALLGSLLLLAGGAQAAIRTNAYSCKAWSANQASDFFFDYGFANGSSSTRTALCPIPAETSIGAAADFDITVSDQSTSAGVECTGAVFDDDGNAIAFTPTVATGISQRGVHTLSTSVSVSSTTTTSYAISCNLPGGPLSPSSVVGVRLF